jgi:hypothetical protein
MNECGILIVLLTVASDASALRAQCAPQWLPGEGIPALDGPVYALTTWDADGSGPQLPLLVAGGAFSVAGNVSANRIATWDSTAWHALGAGLNEQVFGLADFNGQLIAAGDFTTAGGVSANRIARWDGATWQPLGTGMNSTVAPLAVCNGELVAGGAFTIAGGVNASYVARWNGSVWQSVAGGTNQWVYTLAVFNGDLIAGGDFTIAGGVAANRIARWNGEIWQPLGSGMNSSVFALTSFDDELFAGGHFTSAGGITVNRIARWNGTSWQGLGGVGGPGAFVASLTGYNAELIAGGTFTTAAGVGANRIARWNGAGWQPLGMGMDSTVYAVKGYNGQLIAGGAFLTAGGSASPYLARWACPQIAAANPPPTNPYGSGVFRDVLQNTTAGLVPQGIGVAGTPGEGPYDYSAISVTFSGTPLPAPSAANVDHTCTDIASNGEADCPMIASVSGSGAGPYLISLSGPAPARECITFTFAGTSAGQKLQYQVLPGDTNLDGHVSTQDLLTLIQRINDGTASLPANRARYNVNRSNEIGGVVVNTQDLLRLIQLFNGTNATQAFIGAMVADCP